MAEEIKSYKQYIYKDGQFRKTSGGGGAEIRVVDALPDLGEPNVLYVLDDGKSEPTPTPTPSGSSENKNIRTRFKTSELTGHDQILSEPVFTNETNETLYIVPDVEIWKNDDTEKLYTHRLLINNKGERTMPWDLRRRKVNWNGCTKILAPGQSATLLDVLQLPLDFMSTFGSDINDNSTIYQVYPATNHDPRYNITKYYTVGLKDKVMGYKAAPENSYFVNSSRQDATARNRFDYYFQTKNRRKCIYIVSKKVLNAGTKNEQYCINKVYFALNMKFSGEQTIDGDPSLAITFYDINTFDKYL